MKPEILAPAGGFESLVAAVRCGADAVYFGGQALNARRGAENFSDDDLYAAVSYCRLHGVKTYLTLNTLVGDGEFKKAKEIIKRACAIGADALILQDIGISAVVRDYTDIPLHASTQTSVQTPEGINLLTEMGFKRAVLPRELTKNEIKNIAQKTDIELEVFVHGALCMCVSGQCLLSAVLGSRSGNRGLCAQPCRLPFSAEGGTGYDLSLKDLSLLPHLRELKDIGVTSFKIEGRMKRPEYVAAAVTACRAALNGEDDGDINEKLRSVFSRSGFTDGYFTGLRGRKMFGVRGHDDVTAAAPVLSSLKKLYEKEREDVPVDFVFGCKKDEPTYLTAMSGESSATVTGEIPQAAETRGLTEESVLQRLSKCGGTAFYLNSLVTDMDDGLFISASSLNALRRDALSELEEKIKSPVPHSFREPEINIESHNAQEKADIYMRFERASQIPENAKNAKKIILPLSCDTDDFIETGAVPEIPRGIFGSSEKIKKKLLELKNAGIYEAFCGTIDGIAVARESGFRITASFGTNIYNSLSAREIEKLGAKEFLLSVELSLKTCEKIGGSLPRGVFAYGRIPLMLMRNCPARNGRTCDECRESGKLTDRKKAEFPISCVGGCAELLNSCPVYMADKLDDIKNVDFMLYYFTKESRGDCERIIKKYAEKTPFDGTFTRGLFYRGVE
ncbi:MAG: U32 family peptidase [Clostridiales bacterium]|nr:U32 family peptidase [Clostridiales bacterium]